MELRHLDLQFVLMELTACMKDKILMMNVWALSAYLSVHHGNELPSCIRSIHNHKSNLTWFFDP